MANVTISIRPEDQDFIQAAVRSGRYANESEAVADAIAQLRSREASNQMLEELKARVAEGVAQLDQGTVSDWDPAKIRQKGEALLATRTASRSSGT